MDTVTAILLTQLPIAIAILIGAYEIHKTRKIMTQILKKLVEKINKRQKKR